MTFGAAIKNCFSNYATFSGRATRSEFWWFWFLCFLVNLPFNSWIYTIPFYTTAESLVFDSIMMSLLSLIAIALFIPMLAVGARRLHDTGRSAWNLLWPFLPIIGGIVLFVFLLQSSDDDNQYGINPESIPDIDQMDL